MSVSLTEAEMNMRTQYRKASPAEIAAARETLTTARNIIADPHRWRQGAMAYKPNTNPATNREIPETATLVTDPDVCGFCMRGAIAKAHEFVPSRHYRHGPPAYRIAIGMLSCTIADNPGMRTVSVARFNDSHNHAECLAMLDAAISSPDPEPLDLCEPAIDPPKTVPAPADSATLDAPATEAQLTESPVS